MKSWFTTMGLAAILLGSFACGPVATQTLRSKRSPEGSLEASMVLEDSFGTPYIAVSLRESSREVVGDTVFRVKDPIGLDFDWSAPDRLTIRYSGGGVYLHESEWSSGDHKVRVEAENLNTQELRSGLFLSGVVFNDVHISSTPERPLTVSGEGTSDISIGLSSHSKLMLRGFAPSQMNLGVRARREGEPIDWTSAQVSSPRITRTYYAAPRGGIGAYGWSDAWPPLAVPTVTDWGIEVRFAYDLSESDRPLEVDLRLAFRSDSTDYRVQMRATVSPRTAAQTSK